MAKNALLDVLKQTIGKYVKNLDAESLNVAIWGGRIELHSLALNVDAVNAELDRQAADQPNLAIPFRVIDGTFESLLVEFSWAQIMSKPVVIRARGLKASVEPYNRLAKADFLRAVVKNEATRADKIRQARLNSIKIANEHRLSSNAVAKIARMEEGSSSKQNMSTFGTRLANRIAENILIEISDVHVSLKGSDSTAGIVLESLSLVTTDKLGKRTFVDRTSNPEDFANTFLHKIFDVRGLGVYIDDKETGFSKLVSIAEVEQEGRRNSDHRYILSPLSFEAKFRKADGNACIEYSKYELKTELRTLSILLSKTQLENIREITQALQQDVGARPLFPEYRPLCRITKGTANDWWRYAARCLRRINGKRLWIDFLMAFRARKKYILLYKRASHNTSCYWLKELSIMEHTELICIEEDRVISIDGIMMWRNIADAQYEKEQQKYNEKMNNSTQNVTTSVFSSLFGSRDSNTSQLEEDKPPITLTTEELKELNNLTTAQENESTLSEYSKLYDFNFILGSFKVNLTSRDMRPLVALEMGKVAAKLDASVDGSFIFDCKLFSFDILDKVTPNSLFPGILSRTESLSSNDSTDNHVFRLNVAKTKTGDQKLVVKLIQYQVIASPLLIAALRKFVLPTLSTHSNTSNNPTLEGSLSGSIDLFYDAEEGKASVAPDIMKSAKVQDLSNKLVDAWKMKTEQKTSLIIDMDIDAPQLIIPESCVDRRANLLIFDLGHLRFVYGKIESCKIQSWFTENSRLKGEKCVLDNGRLEINNLTFMIETGDTWLRRTSEWSLSSEEKRNAALQTAVVEPISITLELGVESNPEEDDPRVCAIGVIPTISLRISPEQVSKMFIVSSAWLRLLKDLNLPSIQPVELVDFDENHSNNASSGDTDSMRNLRPSATQENDGTDLTIGDDTHESLSIIHFSICLQKLSLTVCTEDGDISANLAAVSVAVSKTSDGASLGRLCMGCFWVLDRFISDGPRQQRLVIHSSLPKSPEEFAVDDKYDIIGELERVGLFEESSESSSDLADITYKQFDTKFSENLVSRGELASTELFGEKKIVDRVLHSKFSSLYIHWNPRAIKTISSYLQKFSDIASLDNQGNELSSETLSRQVLISPPNQLSKITADEKYSYIKRGIMLVQFEMQSLEMSLDSAIDDLPLFILTMSKTSISLWISKNEGKSDQVASLSLGDLKVSTSHLGQTNDEYRTILGLAPGVSKSLVSAKYYDGPRAIRNLSTGDPDVYKYDTYANVVLSPMRAVFIQSQILVLVEYITEGMLGVIAAKAASSAAAAAVEFASSTTETKLFCVQANGAHAILPQSATNLNRFSVHADELEIKYTALPQPRGSMAKLSLSRVWLQDTNNIQMQEDPIRMLINVKIPLLGFGTLEESAMRVDMLISHASFKITKQQFNQLCATLEDNVEELDLFLRDTNDKYDRPTLGITVSRLTHAGTIANDILRRMYVEIDISALSVESAYPNLDPMAKLAAVKAKIIYEKFPDQTITRTKITLANLVCDDLRSKAFGRQYRSLIEQPSKEKAQDLFYVCYEKDYCGNSKTNLQIGSPRLVFIPDVVSEIIGFVTYEWKYYDLNEDMDSLDDNKSESSSKWDDNKNEIRVSSSEDSSNGIYTMSVSATTSRCSIVLVDLVSRSDAAAETIILEGKNSMTSKIEYDKASREMKSMEFDICAEETEIYTAFGSGVKSPTQILEPIGVSVALTILMMGSNQSKIDTRMAATSPLDLSLSMRNIALISAILSGIFECISTNEASKSAENIIPLSLEEVSRIEKLASALESKDDFNSGALDSISCDANSSANVNPSEPIPSKSNYSLITVKTLFDAKITFINDLQGLDQALFQISFQKFFGKGELQRCTDNTFDFLVNTLLLADYFDASVHLWKPLLTKPWEVTVKGTRGKSNKLQSSRLSTRIDFESFPCYVSFSEQFLVSLASANRMWSIYSTAISSAVDEVERRRLNGIQEEGLAERAAAASAARNMITTLPYALDNHAGLDAKFSFPRSEDDFRDCPNEDDFRDCPNDSVQYFRFKTPQGSGFAAKRLYGQDISRKKSLRLHIDGCEIDIDHVDAEIGRPRRAYQLQSGRVVMTLVAEEEKTIVVHLSSSIDVHNKTSIPFSIAFMGKSEMHNVGICRENETNNLGSTGQKVAVVSKGKFAKPSQNFGIPVDKLDGFTQEWKKKGYANVSLRVSPVLSYTHERFHGTIDIHAIRENFLSLNGSIETSHHHVVCRQKGNHIDPFFLQATVEMMLINGVYLRVSISLEPRAEVINTMPVAISVCTLMPHTFSVISNNDDQKNECTHTLLPDWRMEIFTPGPSIALKIKCSDMPVAGSSIGWMEGNWVDLPLVPEFRLLDPLVRTFPFTKLRRVAGKSAATGSQFFILQGRSMFLDLPFLDLKTESLGQAKISTLAIDVSSYELSARSFFVTICNFAVDHTGHILFERVQPSSSTAPFSTFASMRHRMRISLLPLSSKVPIRLLQMSMGSDIGVRRSIPFCVKDISISEGGIQSIPILWENNTSSGYFAYRRLISNHQSEIHIVPEFIIFNGSSKHQLVVRQYGSAVITVDPGKFAPIRVDSHKSGLILSIEYTNFGCRTLPMRCDSLSLRITILKSIANGHPIGSLPIQTVIGAEDSRFVVKVGEVNFGSSHEMSKESSKLSMILKDDFLRVRMQVSELCVTLNESLNANECAPLSTKNLIGLKKEKEKEKEKKLSQNEVCIIVLRRLTLDFQKIFKEGKSISTSQKNILLSPERSQLAVIIHNFQIFDKTPNSLYPMVFDASSQQTSFVDLCARFRGPLDADLVRVDILDLKVSYDNSKTSKIILNTSEDFLWKLLDILDRISRASARFEDVAMSVKWDEKEEGYIVESGNASASPYTSKTKYTPPKSNKLYDINLATVSPFTLVMSFRRTPQASRYEKLSGVRGANVINYFTQQLKFTIDRAALKFAVYTVKNVKGPPDRLLELLTAVYLSRTKRKFFAIFSAASLQDWKHLASRDHGDDSFIEGDLLRATGNLAGNTAGYLLKHVGKGLGTSVRAVTSTFGDGIESATDKIGVGVVGAGINSVVSGVGQGVDDTLSGVGIGAGKILKGAGQGFGQMVGGVSGGVLLVGKGIGKGVAKRSTSEMMSGVTKGVASIGTGVGKGVETAVAGTAGGVVSAGKGLFSGVKNVGKGIGGIFGKKK